MKKKLISVLLAILIIVSILPTQVFADSGSCGENITWTFEDGVLTLSGSGEMYDYNEDPDNDGVSAPWNHYLTVGKIKEIVIGEGITKIGNWAFHEASKAVKISFPSTLTQIGSYAFNGCSGFTYIELPESVTYVGEGAFRYCSKLKCIKIPAGVENLSFGSDLNDHRHIFNGCYALESVEIHEDNKNYVSVNGIIFNKEKTEILFIPTGFEGEFFIPSDIREIDFGVIPSGVSKISVDKDHPLYSTDSQGVLYNKDMTELLYVPKYPPFTELYIPKTVTTISIDYRQWSNELEKFVVDKENPSFASDEQGGLYNKKMTKLIAVPRGYLNLFVVPKGVTTIGDGAFFMSFSSNIIMQEGVKTIGKESFAYCLRLLNLTLPKSVTTIKDKAFYDLMVGDIYYAGSKSAYKNIKFGKENTLYDTKIHYNHSCDHEDIEIYAIENEATCYEKMLVMLKCPDCGYILRMYVGEYAHTKVVAVEGYDPTCTQEGLSDGQFCENCKKEVVSQEPVPAKGHTYGEWVIDSEPTETAAGMRHRECTDCGNIQSEEFGLYEPGDVNGDGKINALDATQILRFANNKSSVLSGMDDAEKYGRADVNGDGKINALDATQILRFANNKSSVLKK